MHFTDIFVRRPVLATVVSLLILLVGMRSFVELELRQFPKMEYSTVRIYTSYPGAESELVQSFVTAPLQEAIAEVDGIDYITAKSEHGLSSITVWTRINYDVNALFSEIQGKVASRRYLMPQEVLDSTISTGSSSDSLLDIAFISDEMNINQVTDYIAREVQPKIQTLEGVGMASIIGKHLAERIWIDPARLAAVDMTPQEFVAKLKANNYQAGIGKIRDDSVEISLATNSSLSDSQAFLDLIIKEIDGSIIRVGDVAQAELGSETNRLLAWLGGRRAAFISIHTSPGANPLVVAERVREILPGIRQQLPDEIELELATDGSKFIRQSIDEVNKTIVETILIVLVVIFLTLGSARAALIPAVTVPLSLIGGVALMLAMGFSLNLMTLLSMILAVGLVVDDAIVVVENVHRHIQEGKSRLDAALQGAREIAVPVIAMTITLLAVYAPIGFMGGLVGSLFTEFAFTLAGAVLISGVIALTLSPMMSAKILRPAGETRGFEAWVEEQFDRTQYFYKRILEATLRTLWLPVVVAFVLLGSIYFMFQNTESELAPDEDQGYVAVMGVGSQTASVEQMEQSGKHVQKIFESLPEYENSFMMFGTAGENIFFGGLELTPWDERGRSQSQVADSIQAQLREVTGANMVAYLYPTIPGTSGGLPLQFIITTSRPFAELDQVSDLVLEDAMNSGKFSFLQKSVSFDRPVSRVMFDRDRVADLGLSMADVGQALSAMVSDAEVGRFNLYGRAYKVIPQVKASSMDTEDDIGNYYLRSDSGDLVPLRSLVSFQKEVEPSVRSQHNQFNAITLEGALAPGVTLGEAIDYMETDAIKVMPKEYSYDYAGQSRQYKQQGTSLVLTFFLSLLIIYLVLAALFESWRDPLIILVTVPLAVVGALTFIMLGATTMNIYTQVGLITLIGVVSKNGILIVEFANKLQADNGLSKKDAVIEAAAIRLRPILMTTVALVVAMIPLLVTTGPGGESRFALGVTIASGLSIGTVLTLLILPAFYILLARNHNADATPDL